MNTLKSALIAASVAFAGPALADGGASFVYFPNLTYPTQDVTVTRVQSSTLEQAPKGCSLLELGAGVQKDVCGTLTQSELVKRKLAQDE
ncbi:hypothetical protein SAMN05444273_106195 [Litoreibacter ascidiaceicola]|uniref:Uncharacterized protein n=1 Tax=Litoreibacter ascidiaceicola TaxID=1486859 RepID=A0A1M5BY91_9RHOB|nr:hypothetical protein [Litoreibacter ascidiaceicola]SHF47421.1 hypothetical protein SAMN05444273_106195 [Litoreibacter ascidiaceicola]